MSENGADSREQWSSGTWALLLLGVYVGSCVATHVCDNIVPIPGPVCEILDIVYAPLDMILFFILRLLFR